MKKLMCVLFEGEAKTRSKVESIAESHKNCPYVKFMATKENRVFTTFFPKNKNSGSNIP